MRVVLSKRQGPSTTVNHVETSRPRAVLLTAACIAHRCLHRCHRLYPWRHSKVGCRRWLSQRQGGFSTHDHSLAADVNSNGVQLVLVWQSIRHLRTVKIDSTDAAALCSTAHQVHLPAYVGLQDHCDAPKSSMGCCVSNSK